MSMVKLAIVVVALALVLGFLFWKFGPIVEKRVEKGPVTLNVSALWEEEALIRPVIDAFEKAHPGITVKYKYESPTNYRTRIQTQIANSEGPDVFMIHNSWLPMFLKDGMVAEAPLEIVDINDVKKSFYPIVWESFGRGEKIYGLSRGVDGLALFYNPEILQAAGVEVPRNWDQFIQAAVRMTVLDASGTIKTAGAALGTTNNVDYFSDILGMLFLQQFSLRPGVDMEKPDSDLGAEVLKFYTQFVTNPKNKVWDTTMESSTQAFASGRLAFYFAPSSKVYEIRSRNPGLQFKVTSVPHLNGTNIGWGTFWGYAVSSRSKNQAESWKFLKYLTSAEVQKFLYQEMAKVRSVGLPYSRIELQSELIDDPVMGAFVLQAPTYKTWYLSSETFDNGVNTETIKYFEEAVNATLAGQDARSALGAASRGVGAVLEKYVKPSKAGD